MLKVATVSLIHDVFHHRCPAYLKKLVTIAYIGLLLLSLTPARAGSDHLPTLSDVTVRTRKAWVHFFRLWTYN